MAEGLTIKPDPTNKSISIYFPDHHICPICNQLVSTYTLLGSDPANPYTKLRIYHQGGEICRLGLLDVVELPSACSWVHVVFQEILDSSLLSEDVIFENHKIALDKMSNAVTTLKNAHARRDTFLVRLRELGMIKRLQ